MSLDSAISALVAGQAQESSTYLNEIIKNISISSTKGIAHCYYIRLDAQGKPRIKDFVDFLIDKVTDFVIPRSEIDEAKRYLEKVGSSLKVNQLRRKAIGLFRKVKLNGEPGELLLYVLMQEILSLPQLLCKMPLKTNAGMAVHGVDGIHVGFDNAKGFLSLYWGEAKIYQDLDQAISVCFKDLSNYLLSDGGSNSPLEREFQLIRDNIDLCSKELEDALLEYLDKNHINYNKVSYKGACLIGFEEDNYPSELNSLTCEELKTIFVSKYSKWVDKVKNRIEGIDQLNSFEIHVFLIPFPNVKKLREYFLEQLT